jgi:hypothetical protein
MLSVGQPFVGECPAFAQELIDPFVVEFQVRDQDAKQSQSGVEPPHAAVRAGHLAAGGLHDQILASNGSKSPVSLR